MAFDREKTLQVAQKYVEKRKYDRAILEYQKVVEQEPNDARTLLRIGDLQARMGSHADAIATYDRVALYYAGRGFSLKAVAVLKQIGELIERHAPQLADQYSHVLPKLAQIYSELGLVNDALATYDAVARRLQNRGRDRDAVEIIRRMVSLDRANALPYLRLAEALCRVTRIDEAIEHFWSAAQLLTQQGRPDDALKVLERILHFRQDPRVARVTAQLYLTQGTRESGMQALARLQLCFEADPRDLETLALLAQAFDVIGQSSKGVEVYKEMVRIAFEADQKELHARYLAHLMRVAPNDPQVRALGAMQGKAPSERPPAVGRVSSSPPELADDDIEFLDDDVVAEPEAEPPAAAPAMGVAAAPTRAASAEVASERAPISASLPSVGPPQVSVDPGTLRPADIQSGPPASEFLRKALVDAESFRGLKLYAKASQCLRQALSAAPESLELRAALQQVLLEAGDRPAAVEQMLAVARMYIERGSLSAAEAELYQVLELSPELPVAMRLLEQVEALSRDSLSRSGRGSRPRRPPPGARQAPPRDEPSSPPSQSEHEAFELRTRVSSPVLRAAATVPPEAELQPARSAAARLRSRRGRSRHRRDTPRELHVPSQRRAARTSARLAAAAVYAGFRPARLSGAASRNATSVRPPPSRRDSIRAALDEAEFFSSRGLYQDASMILRDRLEQYPGDGELIEAIAQLEAEADHGERHARRGTSERGRGTARSPGQPRSGRAAPTPAAE